MAWGDSFVALFLFYNRCFLVSPRFFRGSRAWAPKYKPVGGTPFFLSVSADPGSEPTTKHHGTSSAFFFNFLKYFSAPFVFWFVCSQDEPASWFYFELRPWLA